MACTESLDWRKVKIGWIGVGNIGEPICRNLLKSGLALTICDIAQERLEKFAKDSVWVAKNPGEVAKSSQIIFSALPSDEALHTIVLGENGLAENLGPGKVFVDISTVSPRTSANIARALEPSHCHYLRATVSGSTANASSGTLGMFCSGPRDAYNSCLSILELISDRPSYNGEKEEARILKLLVNIIVIATPTIVGEALAFGKKSGLDWEDMIDAITKSVGASPVINYKTDCMKYRDWAPMATIDLTAKDIDLALEWGKENCVPMPFASLVRQITSGFLSSGDGDKDFFYTLTWPERLMGEQNND